MVVAIIGSVTALAYSGLHMLMQAATDSVTLQIYTTGILHGLLVCSIVLQLRKWWEDRQQGCTKKAMPMDDSCSTPRTLLRSMAVCSDENKAKEKSSAESHPSALPQEFTVEEYERIRKQKEPSALSTRTPASGRRAVRTPKRYGHD